MKTSRDTALEILYAVEELVKNADIKLEEITKELDAKYDIGTDMFHKLQTVNSEISYYLEDGFDCLIELTDEQEAEIRAAEAAPVDFKDYTKEESTPAN